MAGSISFLSPGLGHFPAFSHPTWTSLLCARLSLIRGVYVLSVCCVVLRCGVRVVPSVVAQAENATTAGGGDMKRSTSLEPINSAGQREQWRAEWLHQRG